MRTKYNKKPFAIKIDNEFRFLSCFLFFIGQFIYSIQKERHENEVFRFTRDNCAMI